MTHCPSGEKVRPYGGDSVEIELEFATRRVEADHLGATGGADHEGLLVVATYDGGFVIEWP